MGRTITKSGYIFNEPRSVKLNDKLLLWGTQIFKSSFQFSDQKFGMAPHQSFLTKLPVVLLTSGICLLAGLFIWPTFMPNVAQHGRFVANSLAYHWSFSQLMNTYGQAWLRVQAQVNELRHADEENAKLRLENVHLKLGLETLEFGCHSERGGKATQSFELKLGEETGSKVGRTLATIRYKPPAQFLPSQLYTLGLAYLKAREDEKAAVLFTTLTGSEETRAYKTPQNLLITGIAWYRVDNFKLADFYFDEVLKMPEGEDSIQSQAQARLWKAMIAKRTSKEIKTQYWLKELVDHHPHSAEVGWVNSSEGEHGTAPNP